MMLLLRRFLSWILGWGRHPLKTRVMEELPERISANTVYLLGEGRHRWSAAMLCPCGCGELLQMSLMREGRPRWDLTEHRDGTVSLHPSVWRSVGCRSHFFIRNGRIDWVRGRPARPADPQADRGLERLLWLLLAGLLSGLQAGYVSHLALDSRTTRGLPLAFR